MNIDQMKKILADAPDGATHCADNQKGYYWECADNEHSLSDLRTIINQHEEIENLKGHILVLQRRIEALRERKNWGEIVSAEYYPYAMSDDELIELSKTGKESDNE